MVLRQRCVVSIACFLVITTSEALGVMLMGTRTYNDVLAALEELGDITPKQLDTILGLVDSRRGDEGGSDPRATSEMIEYDDDPLLSDYISQQTASGEMGAEAANYILALLDKAAQDIPAKRPARADYDVTTRGNLQFLGRSVPWFSAFVGNWDGIYNGIWGYSVGRREYALQTRGRGLRIVDITNPSSPFEVQQIPMPGGYTWRDVATHTDISTGVTYAYVAAQGGRADLWVVDLSYLSGDRRHWGLRNPIPRKGYKIVEGYLSDGHTLNVDGGFVFLNSADRGNGIVILDLKDDPWNPVFVAQWSLGDGHDSLFRSGISVPGLGPRDLLYSSDGYSGEHRILDITDVRDTFLATGEPVQLTFDEHVIGVAGEISSGSYAHSAALTEDGGTLYVFDEADLYDIGVFDVSDPRTPVYLTTFQWSGEITDGDAAVHNGKVRGDQLIVAYYGAGLRIFDISVRDDPVEVGNFETLRDPDGTGSMNQGVEGYDGAWNVYADLPSGNILCSDMISGTFVFALDE